MVAFAWALGIVGVLVGLGMSRGEASDGQAPAVGAVLCHDPDISGEVSDEIVAESTAVLREAGVALRVERTYARQCEGVVSEPSVLVVIENERRRGIYIPPPGVGSIQFRGGTPGRVITLSLSGASYLIQRDARVRSLFERVPPRLRNRWTGRMLGRALAHELVHYLLRSPRHTRAGLMRPTHTVEAFVGIDRSPFRLTAMEREQFALNTPQTRHPDSSTATAHPARPTQ